MVSRPGWTGSLLGACLARESESMATKSPIAMSLQNSQCFGTGLEGPKMREKADSLSVADLWYAAVRSILVLSLFRVVSVVQGFVLLGVLRGFWGSLAR